MMIQGTRFMSILPHREMSMKMDMMPKGHKHTG